MDYAFLGRTGVRVSRLCFGTMSFGNEADVDESGRLYARCRDAGINLFDTANIYAQGRSETILGKLVEHERDEIVLTSKAVYPATQDVNGLGASRYHLVRAVEASLKRLNTDRIDVFFLHRVDAFTELDETLHTLEMLVQQGKILYPAISNFAAYQTQRAVDRQEARGYAKFACVQPMYNLLKRQAEAEILPMARENGLGALPYSPLAAGILTGKYVQSTAPDAGRMLSSKQYQTRYGDERYAARAAEFVSLAHEAGVHPATLAVSWVMAHPAVTAPLLGARNVAQLEPALAAADYVIAPELKQKLDALSPPEPATDRTDDGSPHDPWLKRGQGKR